MKNKLIVPVLAITLASGVYFTSVSAFAKDKTERYQSIVQQIAKKFGLNENEVQAVFDNERKQRQTEMQTKYEEMLNQAVKDNKLTEQQRQLILKKHQELQNQKFAKPENWQNLTSQQRMAQMQKQKQELKSWASQNNIDLKYLFGFGVRGKKHDD